MEALITPSRIACEEFSEGKDYLGNDKLGIFGTLQRQFGANVFQRDARVRGVDLAQACFDYIVTKALDEHQSFVTTEIVFVRFHNAVEFGQVAISHRLCQPEIRFQRFLQIWLTENRSL